MRAGHRALCGSGNRSVMSSVVTIGECDLGAAAVASMRATAQRLRAAIGSTTPDRAARAIDAACVELRNPRSPRHRKLSDLLSRDLGWSGTLIAESLDALLEPFSASALNAFAGWQPKLDQMVGFVMAGNIPGAGLHEVMLALVTGGSLMIKSSSVEPHFFQEFVGALADADGAFTDRIAVFNFSRDGADLMSELLRACDFMVVYGDDATIGALAGSRTIGFGSRVSGALVAREASSGTGANEAASAIARDVTLFEQRGCLSPHHVFVEGGDGTASRDFAERIAHALDALACPLTPAPLNAGAAAAIRRARETARWRKLGGAKIDLWEGAHLAWTVIHDPRAQFQLSPQYRTVQVSQFADLADLSARLAPVAGRIEAFAIADPAARLEPTLAHLRSMGATWLCAPGMMQSPALQWRHGGGLFIDRVLARG
jgi:hypothetical protein